MIKAFIIRRKSPRVTTVIGKVRNTRIGLTINLNKARTIAAMMAVPYPSTSIPGSICANTTTATAVNKSLKISFISIVLESEY